MKIRKIRNLALGLLLGGFFLWLTLHHVDGRKLIEVLRDVQTPKVVLAAAVFFIGYSFRIERWRLMIARENHLLRWRDCAGLFMASIAANNVLPFRTGDVLRAFVFNRRLDVSNATALAALIVERLLDLLMMLFFLGIALAYFSIDSSHVVGVGGATLIAGAFLILFLLLAPGAIKPIMLGIGRILSHITPKIGETILTEIEKVFSALGHTAGRGTMLRLVLLSALAWMSEGGVFWIAAFSMPSLESPAAGWLAMPVGTLSTVVPSTPGYIGTFDYFVVQAMALLGNAMDSSTAYAFLVHGLLWFPPTIAGGAYLLLKPFNAKLNGVFHDA